MLKNIFIINCSNGELAEEFASVIAENVDSRIMIIEQENLDSFAAYYENWSPNLVTIVASQDNILSILPYLDDHCTVPKMAVIANSFRDRKLFQTISSQVDEFLLTPLIENDVVYRLENVLVDESQENSEIKKELLKKLGSRDFIGHDPAFLQVAEKIPVLAESDASVLITGETGVGKEVCARSIHYLSLRHQKPFVPVDCGTIPAHLIENELFGHVEGAFTDAKNNQNGLIAEAEGGTLFLDEIDAMSLEAQAKLLRLLEEKCYRPLGQSKYRKANIRILAATNSKLHEKVRAGTFRQDLYYRLNVTINLPALWERRIDIPILSRTLLKKACENHPHSPRGFTKAAMRKLIAYSWPGNIRQLQNIIQQATLLCTGSLITDKDIRFDRTLQEKPDEQLNYREAKQKAIEKFEKAYITQLLICNGGNITRASEQAQKDRRDFGRLVKKYQLDSERFKEMSL